MCSMRQNSEPYNKQNGLEKVQNQVWQSGKVTP